MSSTPMDCNPQPESSGLVISPRMSHSDTSMSLISKTLDLTAAAESGNWTLLDDWLSSDDVTRCDVEQSYILHRLAAAPEVSLSLARDILTKILKHKVDINMVDTNGDTAVVVAARCDNTKMVMELLSRQAALPPDVTHVCSFLQTLTNNWKPQETPYMHALVVKLLWDRLQDTALHSCHKQLHHTLVRLAVTFHTSLVREMFVTEQQVNTVDSEGMAVLHRLAMFDSDDHVRVVLFLISKGANVNLQTTTGDTPLHVAAKHKSWAIMEVLLHRQAKSDVVDCEQRSVLHKMASYANPKCFSEVNDILPLLFHNNTDINKRDREGNTALHLAALAGNMGFVKTLLHHGARADGVNGENKTVLHMMAISRSKHLLSNDSCRNILSLILNKGADVHRTDCYGHLAVHLAAKHNKWDFVEFLSRYLSDLSHPDREGFNILHRFAIQSSSKQLHLFYQLCHKVGDINARSRSGDAAVHLAAKYQNWDTLQMLVQQGALINEPDSEGCCLFQILAKAGKIEKLAFCLLREEQELYCNSRFLYKARKLTTEQVWSVIVKYMGNINQVDSEGLTLVQRLVMSKEGQLHTYIFCRLLELGADVTCRDANGDTVCHLAARNGHWEIVRYLLELGEGTDNLDSDGLSVLHRAAKANTEIARDVLSYILQRNPDLHKRTRQGDTAVHVAARCQQWETVKTLTKLGANIFDYDSQNTSVLQRMIRCPSSIRIELSILQNSTATYTAQQLTNSLLLKAAQVCRLNVVRFLLDQGVSIHQRDSEGLSLLHHIAKTREYFSIDMTEHLEYFLDKGICLEDKCPNGNTPLHLAAKSDNWDLVNYLVEQGASIQDPDSEGFFVLQRLAMSSSYDENQREFLRLVIKKGADVKARDSNGNSLLHLGGKANNWSFVLHIIQESNNLEPEELDNDGFNLLHRLALFDECSNWMEKLLNKNFNLCGNGDTCLLLAAYFLDKGIGLEDKCPNGNTPLHLAAKSDHWGLVNYLVKQGANIQDPDSDGVYVLQRLAMYSEYGEKHIEILRLLITNGADVNILDCNGDSILHLSAKANNWSFVRQIIQETGDLITDELDSDGYNILHRLAQSGHSELVEAVLNKGCNVEALSRDGDTCLLLAAKRDNWTFVTRVLGPVFSRNTSPSFAQDARSISQINLNTRDLRGYTVCYLALIRKRWDLLRRLAEWGYNMDMDIIDNEGLDLLQTMASDNASELKTHRNWCRLLKCMKENRFIFTQKNGLGNTPFQTAAKNKNILGVICLYFHYKGGEDFNSTDSDGLSPLYRLVDILNKSKEDLNFRKTLARIIQDILISCKAPEKISWDGNTPLHLAAKCSEWLTVKMLLQHGARADVCDLEGFTVLHRFVQYVTVRKYLWQESTFFVTKALFIKKLLQSGASLHQKNLEGNTPLHLAVQYQKWDVATELVHLGAEVNELDSEGYTILQRLAQVPYLRHGHSCVVLIELLLERGARCDIPSKRGETLFDIVVENKNWIMMKCLLTQEMIVIREHDDKFLLHRFVFSYNGALHSDVCDLLIEKGLSVNAEDCEGNTPLHVAARVGNWDLVAHFIRKGGSGRKPDGNGFSILHRFVTSVNTSHEDMEEDDYEDMEEYLDTLDVILSSGVDVNATDPRGNTAIHIAAKRQLLDIVNHLIDIVDNLNTTDSDGFTVLLRLAQTPHPQCLHVLRRLLQKGADINFCSIQGESVLTLAVKSNNWPVVQFLVSRGVQCSVQTLEQLHTIHRLIKSSSSTFVEDKQVKLMTLLSNSGLSINVLDQCGKTPAELALIHKKWKLLRYLLKSKAHIISKRDSFFHDLARHCIAGDIFTDITRLLVIYGLDINQQNIFGVTPVHVAADEENWDAVIVFVENGAHINILDRYGRSLLHTVVGHLSSQDSRQLNKLQLLTFLVEHGADINRRSQNNKAVLQIAAARDDWETVGALIQLGADCELTPSEKKSAFSKLHLFRWENVDEEKVCRFVNYITNEVFDTNDSFQKEDKCDKKKSILQMCLKKSNWPMAKALVECGADVFQLYTHRTLLEFMMSAYSYSNTTAWMSFLDSVIAKGLDINTKLRNGSGVLFHDETIRSITRGDKVNSRLFISLLERGANPLIVDSRGQTLLQTVLESDRRSMLRGLKKLIPVGVTTHQPRFTEAMLQSQSGSTAQTVSPTEKMIEDKNFCVLKLLIESGASSNAELFRLNTEYQVKLAGQADTDDNIRELLEVLNMAASQPRSLQSLCRLTVSHCLGCGPGRTDKLNSLNICPLLRELVSFNDLLSEDFFLQIDKDDSSSSSISGDKYY
ncbi:uncharacterized protein LOC112559060 [Pomacea canaliculata]|uniref:uncharacterized protein LOC112559060 n=1 Tax=Pomacea canaliculata TaxID=400727 RepID=UPI000D738AEF|nr:uncharacterized protein LOC112559060 [Pomacea canaliculata]XP_025085729.1 uncharacterized protein LOC112559060 [Pomacea canaliculata]XP_025085730.1 uncharacterized protein LOC112559060 [Pomacea canaliculata]